VLDTDEIVNANVRTNAQRVAQGFIKALGQAYELIGAYPTSGSRSLPQGLELPGMRCWRMRQPPYLIFYLIRSDRVEVYRVIHGRRAMRIDARFLEVRRLLGL
jgi:toxin ParE1/3/4